MIAFEVQCKTGPVTLWFAGPEDAELITRLPACGYWTSSKPAEARAQNIVNNNMPKQTGFGSMWTFDGPRDLEWFKEELRNSGPGGCYLYFATSFVQENEYGPVSP